MSARLPTERVFALPCFEGLRLLRRYQAQHPAMPVDELLVIIYRVEADARNLDMEASVYLSGIVEADCVLTGRAFYQSCIRAVLISHQPLWAKAMRSGRKRFVRTLDRNDQDIFNAAGLMDEPPAIQVVEWWDEVAGHARLLSDQLKMQQGRAAEILTLDYERERLQKLGIDREPEWPGFDDNFAGYDVLSFDKTDSGIIGRMIEVKSTTSSPLRFSVTRNEWSKAEQSPDAYHFHLWDMAANPPRLHQRTVDEVRPHVPTDNKDGRWSNAVVPIGAA